MPNEYHYNNAAQAAKSAMSVIYTGRLGGPRHQARALLPLLLILTLPAKGSSLADILENLGNVGLNAILLS